jgi:hypothetical protein
MTLQEILQRAVRPQAKRPLAWCSGATSSCDLLFGAPPDKEQSATDYVADLVYRLHDIHH